MSNAHATQDTRFFTHLFTAENEANVRWALDSFPCLRLDVATPVLGGPGLTGTDPVTGDGCCPLVFNTLAMCALQVCMLWLIVMGHISAS